MSESYQQIPPDANETGKALQKWSSKRVENASERISEAGKFLFSVSSVSIGFLITLSSNKSDGVISSHFILYALLLFVIGSIFPLCFSAILSFKLKSTSDLKKDFLSQQKIYHTALAMWFVFWVVGIYFSYRALAVSTETATFLVPA